MPEADLRRDQLKDPVGDLYYPLHKGRDGCRTPMPWDADKHHLGFSTGSPWLPMAPEHRALAVSRQESEDSSTLKFARAFLAARKKHPALRLGEIVFRDASGPLLVFERRLENERILCAFNMSAEKVVFAPDQNARAIDVDGQPALRHAAGRRKSQVQRTCAAYGFRLFRL